jgi:hypothetical protein
MNILKSNKDSDEIIASIKLAYQLLGYSRIAHYTCTLLLSYTSIISNILF